uniref:Thymocyte nuclear protein 1 n=1 Tax=Cercocebus atys TaxID=9531 RepID=A0A2K5KWY0_CERAT
MSRPRKRLAGTSGSDKGLSGKRTKTEHSFFLLAEVEDSNPQKTSATKNCVKNLSSHWLMKSEPESRLEKGVDVKFSIEDLKAQPKQTTCWDGVRNYQVRGWIWIKDWLCFFLQANDSKLLFWFQIVFFFYPDHTQFEKNNPHYDPSSKEDNPKWSMVDFFFVRMMKRFIPLAELKSYHQAHKATGGPLKNMTFFFRQRLSIQPLTQEFDFVLSLEEKEPS